MSLIVIFKSGNDVVNSVRICFAPSGPAGWLGAGGMSTHVVLRILSRSAGSFRLNASYHSATSFMSGLLSCPWAAESKIRASKSDRYFLILARMQSRRSSCRRRQPASDPRRSLPRRSTRGFFARAGPATRPQLLHRLCQRLRPATVAENDLVAGLHSVRCKSLPDAAGADNSNLHAIRPDQLP